MQKKKHLEMLSLAVSGSFGEKDLFDLKDVFVNFRKNASKQQKKQLTLAVCGSF